MKTPTLCYPVGHRKYKKDDEDVPEVGVEDGDRDVDLGDGDGDEDTHPLQTAQQIPNQSRA